MTKSMKRPWYFVLAAILVISIITLPVKQGPRGNDYPRSYGSGT